jgi:hypothetical protein
MTRLDISASGMRFSYRLRRLYSVHHPNPLPQMKTKNGVRVLFNSPTSREC